MTEGIEEWGEDGKREVYIGQTFGILIIWITFISFLGRLSLCWLEVGRRVIGGDGGILSLCTGVWAGPQIRLVWA